MPIWGRPCLDFSMLQLHHAGVKTAVVNVHAHAEQLRKYLESYNPSQTDIHSNSMTAIESNEESKLLGSAGGFRKALPLLQSQEQMFYAMNADVMNTVDLKSLLQRHLELKSKHQVTMTLAVAVGKMLTQTTECYRELLMDSRSGLLTRLGEKKLQAPFYTGVGIFEPECFQNLKLNEPAEFVPDVLVPALQASKVGFYQYEGLFLDIGSPLLWWQAHQKIRQFVKNATQFQSDSLMPEATIPDSWLMALNSVGRLDALSKPFQEPWPGWIQYGNHPPPDNRVGKPGIQLDNWIYELPL
jgi:NDP-sugar pyrophosphorylase family protein